MSEQRRAAIVASTLPLLIENGSDVSTSQIAAAAGIAEGTVFRAFKDKQELLIPACAPAWSPTRRPHSSAASTEDSRSPTG
jgi:hypothetical protein